MAANKPPQQYNPMMMQLAQQMMLAGQQRPVTYGQTDGLAAGLTSAGNSLVGALMMKPQMKAYKEDQEHERLLSNRIAAKVLGWELDEEGNLIDPSTQKAASPAAQQLASTLSQIPGMNVKMPGSTSRPKSAAGAPSGQEAAPAALGTQRAAAYAQDQPMREVLALMMQSRSPQTRVAAMNGLIQLASKSRDPSKEWMKFGEDRAYHIPTQRWMLAPPAPFTLGPGDTRTIPFIGSEGEIRYASYENPTDDTWSIEYEFDEAATKKFQDETGYFVPHQRPVHINNKTHEVYRLDVAPGPRHVQVNLEGDPGLTSGTLTDLQGKILSTEDTIARFDESLSLFDPSYLTWQGKGLYKIKGFFSSLGVSMGEEYQDQAQFYAAVNDAANRYIKEITGAQMSGYEIDRLLQAIPNVQDNPDQWIGKMKLVTRVARAALDRYRRALTSATGPINTHEEQAKKAADAEVDRWFDNDGNLLAAPRGVYGAR